MPFMRPAGEQHDMDPDARDVFIYDLSWSIVSQPAAIHDPVEQSGGAVRRLAYNQLLCDVRRFLAELAQDSVGKQGPFALHEME